MQGGPKRRAKGLRQFLDSVTGPSRLARHTYRCPCVSLCLEETHEASQRPQKGIESAQKAFQRSETETRMLLG